MKEIRLHGRGGQGVALGAEMLAAAFVNEGKYATSLPMFGAEIRGTLVSAFVRFDTKPIAQRTQAYSPDAVVVVDPFLRNSPAIVQGLPPGASMVLNSPVDLEESLHENLYTVGTVDATGIALQEIGRPIVGTCMLGALAKMTGWFSLQSLLASLEGYFQGPMLEKNIRSARRGFEETKVNTHLFREAKTHRPQPGAPILDATVRADRPPPSTPKRSADGGFYDTLSIAYGECPSDCSACVDACVVAKDGSGPEDGRVATVRVPEIGFSGALTCLQCGQPSCVPVCPTGAITRSERDGVVRIADDECVGCALCTLACEYGGALYDAGKKKSFKCDRCDGQPKCVEACQYGVLTYERTSALRQYLRADDPFVRGTGMCHGCPAELAERMTARILGADTFIFVAPGCGASPTVGKGTEASTTIPGTMCLMTNIPSTMTGVKRYYRNQGQDVRVVAFVGDGATADIGFQPLSGAAERGENLIYICYDNEAYMGTGVQRSGSTPLYAWTNTTPIGKLRRGKQQVPKNVPLLMAMHGIPYVATATVGYLEDFAQKLRKAAHVKDGMAYIHLLSPCPTGWRFPIDSAIEICHAAVESRYFPLWEAEYGKVRVTKEVTDPKPLAEFLKLMGRYAHMNEDEIQEIQRVADSKYEFLCKQSTL